jgi:hypothetical protein
MNIKNTIFLAPLLLVAPLSAQEESNAEAEPSISEQVLKAMPDVFSRSLDALQQPWECTMKISGDIDGSSLEGTGTASYFHSRMFAYSLELSGNTSDGEVSGSFRLVADDNYLNIEVDSSMSPIPQAFKVDLDLLEELGDIAADGDQLATAGIEPSEIIENIAALDFQLVESEDGKITTVTIDPTKMIEGRGGDSSTAVTVTLCFDNKTAFPQLLSFSIVGDESVSIDFVDVSFPQEIDEEKYSYTPGEGMIPMDLTGMIRMGMQANVGDGMEEEF